MWINPKFAKSINEVAGRKHIEGENGKKSHVKWHLQFTLQILSGGRSSPFMPQNVLGSQQPNTGDFQFSQIL